MSRSASISGFKLPVMDEFGFQRMEEAFHRGVIVAIGPAAHRGFEAGGLQDLTVLCRGVLNAAIGMMDQTRARPLFLDCHPQRSQGQFDAQMICHCPAHNAAAVQVEDRRQIQPSLTGLDIGDVGKPDLIARGGREVAAKQIRGDWKAMATIGGAAAPGLCHDGSNAMVAHLSLDPAAACTMPLRSELDMNPRAAIAAMAVAIDPLDVRQQLAIGNGPRAFRTRPPSVVAGRRDLEHTAHHPYGIVGAAIFDEAEPHVRGPAKIAIDFFKMSRSMRNCSFSRCNRANVSLVRRRQRRLRCGSRGAAAGSRRVPIRYPSAQHRAVKPEFIGYRFRRATAGDNKINRPPLVFVRI